MTATAAATRNAMVLSRCLDMVEPPGWWAVGPREMGVAGTWSAVVAGTCGEDDTRERQEVPRGGYERERACRTPVTVSTPAPAKPRTKGASTAPRIEPMKPHPPKVWAIRI